MLKLYRIYSRWYQDRVSDVTKFASKQTPLEGGVRYKISLYFT